jgi:hypothetical protein
MFSLFSLVPWDNVSEIMTQFYESKYMLLAERIPNVDVVVVFIGVFWKEAQ